MNTSNLTVRRFGSYPAILELPNLVEGAPKTVKAGVTKDEANAMKKQLEDAGGKAKLA